MSVCFFSCKKHISEENNPVVNTPSFSIPAATPVNGSVSGRIIDENNAPVSLAIVECAGVTSSTDADGFFNVNNVTLDKYISTVKVTKTGYFTGYRSFCANADRNFVNIKLIPKILSAAISSSSAETVTLSNSTQINFQANSMVIKSSGATYNGTVNVYASYIDPTSADISATVPGSFMGADDKNLYALQSAGMIAVELESASGEALQLASNMPATIKLAIPSSLTSTAPSSIDTWSLDDRGVWKKEGSAPRSGNFYEMQATHFSFWNCDVPSSSIYLSIHLVDQNANPLIYKIVQLVPTSNTIFPGVSYGVTDISGNVSGIVPANDLMHMTIIDYQCNAPNIQDIGPFSSNNSITVVATIDTATILTISGTVNNCTGQPLQNGTVFISGVNYYGGATILNGNYTATIASCIPASAVNITIWDNSDPSAQVNAGSFTVTGNALAVPLVTTSCAQPRNIYDGIYTVVSGNVIRYLSPGVPANDALSGDLAGNPDVYMITSGTNSCLIAPPPGPGQLYWAFGSGSSVAGIDPLEMTVDGSNNTTMASLVVPNLANLAGQINTYDPATQTFHLSFTWTNTAGAPRDYEIVLKYSQPRP